jgi:uncharacterized protein
MKNMEADQKFLEEIIRAIVGNPDDVKSTRTVDERGVLLTLDVNPADMGYVIGRSGQTARAVRTLLKIVGAKSNARVNLKISEPEGGRGPNPRREDGETEATPVETTPVEETPIDTSAVDELNI